MLPEIDHCKYSQLEKLYNSSIRKIFLWITCIQLSDCCILLILAKSRLYLKQKTSNMKWYCPTIIFLTKFTAYIHDHGLFLQLSPHLQYSVHNICNDREPQFLVQALHLHVVWYSLGMNDKHLSGYKTDSILCHPYDVTSIVVPLPIKRLANKRTK